MSDRAVKIVATVGPASRSKEKLESLLLNGVNVFRLNFSHGTHEEHAQVYKAVRELGHKHGLCPTILADLQGPKLRIGTFENEKIFLEAGDLFSFDSDPTPGDTHRVHLPHPEILEALQVGTRLLLNDGKICCEVTHNEEGLVETQVLVGGPLSNKKGLSIPHAALPITALTDKDKIDLKFVLGLGVDWIALSFVQRLQDIEEARQIIGDRALIISKLEKPLAVQHMNPIIAASDGVMIARGDMGVELNPEEVPGLQKRIIEVCNQLGKPVIVATHMLESMISAPTPTRAEVSDIANAVFDGTDATMLSAESASGDYSLEAVQMMDRVISRAEKEKFFVKHFENEGTQSKESLLDALCLAAQDAAKYSCATAIVLYTDKLETVARCARLRPHCKIVLMTDSLEFASRVGVFRGVQATLCKKEFDHKEIIESVKSALRKFAKHGENIVVLDTISENSVTFIQL